MALCQALEAIVKSCDPNAGGLQGIAIIQQDDIDNVVVNIAAAGDWEVTGITTLGTPAADFTNYAIRRNTCNYTEDTANDLVNGSTVVTQTINLVFHRREAAKSRSINILGSGQQYLAAIVKDMNGIYWYFDFLQLTATGEGSGTARADGSKYTVTLVSESEHLAYQVTINAAGLGTLGVNF